MSISHFSDAFSKRLCLQKSLPQLCAPFWSWRKYCTTRNKQAFFLFLARSLKAFSFPPSSSKSWKHFPSLVEQFYRYKERCYMPTFLDFTAPPCNIQWQSRENCTFGFTNNKHKELACMQFRAGSISLLRERCHSCLGSRPGGLICCLRRGPRARFCSSFWRGWPRGIARGRRRRPRTPDRPRPPPQSSSQSLLKGFPLQKRRDGIFRFLSEDCIRVESVSEGKCKSQRDAVKAWGKAFLPLSALGTTLNNGTDRLGWTFLLT